MKKALCLQGGGAKGAYQAGAIKALKEKGYKFDCAVGASVGCINAAMYCLGKVDELCDLWKEIDFADVLPLERETEGGNLTLKSIFSTAWEALSSGVDTSRIRAIIEKHVDEEALRASKIRFGLVTVRTGDWKPVLCEMFIEDIPQGKLVDYMMASAALPFFKKVEIDGVRYMDGGILDNLPIEMLAKAGYTDIMAIRLGGDIRYTKGIIPLNVTYIDPSESPGSMINFSNFSITRALNLGYFDVLRITEGLCGKRYYIKPCSESKLKAFLTKHSESLERALSYLNVHIGDNFKERLIALTVLIGEYLGQRGCTIVGVWMNYAEYLAAHFELDRWKVYSVEDMLKNTAQIATFADHLQKEEDSQKLLAVAKILFEELKHGNE